jgi:hypothetical protein
MYPYLATHLQVKVIPAVYPSLVEFLHFEIESLLVVVLERYLTMKWKRKLTFRTLGRNHIASSPLSGHRSAMFYFDNPNFQALFN